MTAARSALILGSCLLVAACATKSNDAARAQIVGSTQSAIQGGMSDAKSTFAVGLFDSANETCSGTLIAPNLVLTARHCVSTDTGSDFVDCSEDEFNAPASAHTFRVSLATKSATFATAKYEGIRVLVPTDKKFCGNDIALIILDQNVPASEAKPAIPAIDPNAKGSVYGSKLTVIGYGTTEPGGNDEGSRRRLDDVPIRCIPDDPAKPCTPSLYDMTKTELATGDGLCEGDSGGGAYLSATIDTAPQVIGVLSRGSDNGTECTDAVYTRTDAFADFLIAGAEEAAAEGEYPLPAWVTNSTPTTNEPEPEPKEPVDSSPPAKETPEETPVTTPAAAPTVTTTESCQMSSRRASSSSSMTALVALAIAAVLRRKKS